MSTATPEPTSNPPSGQSEQQPTQEAVQQATQQHVEDAQRRVAAGEITPDQFLAELRSLPDKVVDAIREAFPAPSKTATTATETQQQQQKETPGPGRKWFGYSSFGEFMFGDRA